MAFLEEKSLEADILKSVISGNYQKSIGSGSDQDSTEADRNYRQLVSNNPDMEEILDYLFVVDEIKYPLSPKVLQYYNIRKKERFREGIDFKDCEGVVIGKYTGYTFKNGVPFGKGYLTYNNEEGEWEGYFFNGMMHGDGYLYKNRIKGSEEAIPLTMVNNKKGLSDKELEEDIKLLKKLVKNVDTKLFPVGREIIERYFEVGVDPGSNYKRRDIDGHGFSYTRKDDINDQEEVILQDYRGATLDKIPHGEGSVCIGDGLRWKGNFLCGMMHGVGELFQNEKPVGHQTRIYGFESLTMRVEENRTIEINEVYVRDDIFDIHYNTKNGESTFKIR